MNFPTTHMWALFTLNMLGTLTWGVSWAKSSNVISALLKTFEYFIYFIALFANFSPMESSKPGKLTHKKGSSVYAVA